MLSVPFVRKGIKDIHPSMVSMVWVSSGVLISTLVLLIVAVVATATPKGIFDEYYGRLRFVSDGFVLNRWSPFACLVCIVCELALVSIFSGCAARRTLNPQPLGARTPLVVIALSIVACVGFIVVVIFPVDLDQKPAHFGGVGIFLTAHIFMHATAILQMDFIVGNRASRSFIYAVCGMQILLGSLMATFFFLGAGGESKWLSVSAGAEYAIVLVMVVCCAWTGGRIQHIAETFSVCGSANEGLWQPIVVQNADYTCTDVSVVASAQQVTLVFPSGVSRGKAARLKESLFPVRESPDGFGSGRELLSMHDGEE